jgi:hypothetical protein
MLELFEEFFEQKHPNPNKDDQEEEEEEEKKKVVNDLYVFYKNFKTFIEMFLVD